MFNWFRKKKSPMDYEAIIKFAISDLMSADGLATPVYRPDIVNESDAESRKDLPLVYIWNEDPKTGSFSLSVNGNIVGYCLEAIVPRSDPMFARCRDRIMQTISDLTQSAVLSTCEKARCLPSHIFLEKAA